MITALQTSHFSCWPCGLRVASTEIEACIPEQLTTPVGLSILDTPERDCYPGWMPEEVWHFMQDTEMPLCGKVDVRAKVRADFMDLRRTMALIKMLGGKLCGACARNLRRESNAP